MSRNKFFVPNFEKDKTYVLFSFGKEGIEKSRCSLRTCCAGVELVTYDLFHNASTLFSKHVILPAADILQLFTIKKLHLLFRC
jgi:hypothetical protein